MQLRGERDQLRGAFVCLAIATASAIAILTGARDMTALGYETWSTAARIGLGLFLLIMSLAMLAVFTWGYRVVRDLRVGRTLFRGWTVSPADYDRFRGGDAALAPQRGPSDYRPLATTPAEGVEVAFSRDGLLIGGRYFVLAATGLQRFESATMIRSDPSMLQFGIVTTSVNRFSSRLVRSVLRVPLSSGALGEAEAVLAHYQAVLRGDVIVHPNFWKARIKGGLIVAAVSAACAATGFLLLDRNAALHDAPEIMMITGVLAGGGGLLVALIAWARDRAQSRR